MYGGLNLPAPQLFDLVTRQARADDALRQQRQRIAHVGVEIELGQRDYQVIQHRSHQLQYTAARGCRRVTSLQPWAASDIGTTPGYQPLPKPAREPVIDPARRC